MMQWAYRFARRYNLPREHASRSRASPARRAMRCGRFCCRHHPRRHLRGVVTATEAAALAVVASIVVGFVIYRDSTLRSCGKR